MTFLFFVYYFVWLQVTNSLIFPEIGISLFHSRCIDLIDGSYVLGTNFMDDVWTVRFVSIFTGLEEA